MRNMPSIDSGQKRSSASQPGWVRSETPMASTNVEAIARLSANVSARITPRAIRPVPSAWVRHSTRSRNSTPTWKSPDPRPKTTRPVVSCGSWPTARIEADHATAPAVSTRPWSRKGRVGLVAEPGVAVATSERAGAGECEIVTVVTPVRW